MIIRNPRIFGQKNLNRNERRNYYMPHIDDYKLYRANVLKILGRFDEAEEIMKQVKKIKT